MVELETQQISAVFHALGDSTRRRMLLSLSSGPRTVSELAEPFDMSLAAASKHIKVLEAAGLVRREVLCRTHVCRLEPEPLADAHAWLSFYEGFWNGRLENMQRLLRAEAAASPSSDKQRGNRSMAAGTN